MKITKENCAACVCYRAEHNACRRHAPVPFFAGVHPVSQQPLIISAFPSPPLGKYDWCGEFMQDMTLILQH